MLSDPPTNHATLAAWLLAHVEEVIDVLVGCVRAGRPDVLRALAELCPGNHPPVGAGPGPSCVLCLLGKVHTTRLARGSGAEAIHG